MIRTRRLVLRPGRRDDLDAFHAMFSDPVAMRYWDRPPHTDVEQTRDFLARFIEADSGNREEYVLDCDGVCIGKAGCWRKAEVGYILSPDFWGRGYATEALAAILPRAFAKFDDAPEITAELDPRNAASVRLLTRLGFAHVRTEEKNFLYGESEWCDTAYYALTRDGFRQAPVHDMPG